MFFYFWYFGKLNVNHTLFSPKTRKVSGSVLIVFTCNWWLISLITKDAPQPDLVEGFVEAPKAATLWLMAVHAAQLRWKGQTGSYPNPSGQHSLWEETNVPGENLQFSVECWLTRQENISFLIFRYWWPIFSHNRPVLWPQPTLDKAAIK